MKAKKAKSKKIWMHALMFSAILVLDRIFKYSLIDGCLGILCIRRAFNDGASFGILRGMVPLFIIVAALVLVLIFFFYKTADGRTKLALVFIASGTMANLIDRIFYNGVIDLFSVLGSSSFNLADMSNALGGILLVLALLKQKE